jgi:transcriptional regulator with XRE-family HTH domain
MEGFGERIRDLRLMKGLSQEAVAAQLGVTPQAVSKWENGKSVPDASMIVPLANIFQISADKLLDNGQAAEKWDADWHRSIKAGDPAQAAVTALQALEQFPGDTRFLCRVAQAEFLAGIRAQTEEDRQRFLLASEQHHRAILRQFPDYEEAAYRLAMTLNALGKTKEAEIRIRSLKHYDTALLEILRGEAREKELRRLTAQRAYDFYQMLMLRPAHDKMDLAEKLLTEFPWDPRDRLNLLSAVCCSRAVLYCRDGKPDAAMKALYRVKELACKWSALQKSGEGSESPYFGRVFGSSEGPDVLFAFSLLHDPKLAPLFEREEYKELVRLRDQTMERMGMTIIKEW